MLTYVLRKGSIREKDRNTDKRRRPRVKCRKGRQGFVRRMFDAQANPSQHTCLVKPDGNDVVLFRFYLGKSIGDGLTRQANRICCLNQHIRRRVPLFENGELGNGDDCSKAANTQECQGDTEANSVDCVELHWSCGGPVFNLFCWSPATRGCGTSGNQAKGFTNRCPWPLRTALEIEKLSSGGRGQPSVGPACLAGLNAHSGWKCPVAVSLNNGYLPGRDTTFRPITVS